MKIDLLCEVVDNFGDAGIAWRLACQLHDELNAQVTLWIDQPQILQGWRAQRVTPVVRPINQLSTTYVPGNVLIAVLTARVPDDVHAQLIAHRVLWIRYEHLSAEPWIDGCHGLPSPKPQLADNLANACEWYYYPGFTAHSGGLMRERKLLEQRHKFSDLKEHWLARQGWQSGPETLRVCLFGYVSPSDTALDQFLQALQSLSQPVQIIVSEAVYQALGRPDSKAANITIKCHGWLSLDDFDRLLWCSDLNVVRGEDSWVRAQWAGQPFIWQPYRQEQASHCGKLQAFLARFIAGTGHAFADQAHDQRPPRADCKTGCKTGCKTDCKTDHQTDAHRAICALMHALTPATDPAVSGEARATEQSAMRGALQAYLDNFEQIRALHQQWQGHLTAQNSLIERLQNFIQDHLQSPV